MEPDAVVLDPVAEDINNAAPPELVREMFEKVLLVVRAPEFLEPFPVLGLAGDDEVGDLTGDQAALAVVLGGGAAMVAAGLERGTVAGVRFADTGLVGGKGIGAALEEGAFDGVLEGLFGGGCGPRGSDDEVGGPGAGGRLCVLECTGERCLRLGCGPCGIKETPLTPSRRSAR